MANTGQTTFHNKITCEKVKPEVPSTSKQFTLDWLTPRILYWILHTSDRDPSKWFPQGTCFPRVLKMWLFRFWLTKNIWKHIVSKLRSSAEGQVWSEYRVSSQETTSTIKAQTVCVFSTLRQHRRNTTSMHILWYLREVATYLTWSAYIACSFNLVPFTSTLTIS